MNVEESVRASMSELARRFPSPAPNPVAVRARLHRGRRVRTIAAIGIAATVAAGTVVSVTQLRDRQDGTAPTGPVQIGVDSQAVWMVDGVLHLGDRAFAQDRDIVTALVPLEDGAVYGASGGEIVYQPVDGPAQVIETDGDADPAGGPVPLGPAADPDSDVVAVLRWNTADNRYDLYFYDAGRGRQIGTGVALGDESWTLPGDPNPFGGSPVAPLYWVGRSGAAYTALIRNGQELWREDAKGGGASSLRPLGDAPLDATLRVIATADADGKVTFRTASGEVLSSVETASSDGGLSHDGAFYAAISADAGHPGEVAVVDTSTGETHYITPPEGTDATLPSWSTGHTLMFRATDTVAAPSGLIVSCDAESLRCENVARVDDVNDTVLPRL